MATTIQSDKNVTARRSLLRSTLNVSLMSFLSRILGFVRDVVIAQLFGAGLATDAFFAAFKLPDFLRRLFAEGAFAQAIVPSLAQVHQQGGKGSIRVLVSQILGVLGIILLFLSIIGCLITPLLIYLLAPGFTPGSVRFEWAIQMLRIMFPYLFFIGMTAFMAAVQNTYERFMIPAFTPIWLNILLIISGYLLAHYLSVPIIALAWGVLVAGFLQALFQLPSLASLGLLVRPSWRLNVQARNLLKLLLPALLGVSTLQINLLLDMILASLLKIGSVSWLYYSERLMNFPLSILAVTVAIIILPQLAKQYLDHQPNQFADALQRGIKLVLLIGMPASIGLAQLASPLLITLLQHGHFTFTDVLKTQQSLIAFALGLPFFMIVKVLLSACYALKKFRVVVWISSLSVVSNLVFGLLLMPLLAHAGIALATSLSALLNTCLLGLVIKRTGFYQPTLKNKHFLLHLLIANLIMIIWIYFINKPLAQWVLWSSWQRINHLCLIITGAVLSYYISLRVIKLR